MKLRMIVLCMFSLMPALALAEVKTEIVPAAQLERQGEAAQLAKPVKLSLTDTSPTDAVAAFVKETGIALTFDNAERQASGPVITYDVAIDAATLDDALDQLGQSLRLGIYRQSEKAFRISPNYDVGFNERRNNFGQDMEGGTKARITGIRTMRIAGQTTYSPGQEFTVSIVVAARDVMLTGQPEVKLIEAIDEQGRKLEQAKPSSTMFFGGSNLQRLRSTLSVSLQLSRPEPDPAQIKSLKGEVVLKNVKSFSKTTVTELDKQVEITLDGVKLTVGPLAKSGDAWRLPVKTPPGKPEARGNMYQRLNFLFNESAQATGEAGERLRINSGGSSSSPEGDEMFLQFFSDGSNRPASTQPATQPATRPARPDGIKPVKVTWSVPNEVEVISIPFEAANLIVP